MEGSSAHAEWCERNTSVPRSAAVIFKETSLICKPVSQQDHADERYTMT